METKKVFKYFTIVNHEKEEEYLRSMHKDGWKFKKVSGFCMYHFEKCEPEDVIYRLDYNRDGILHKSEYTKMFEDCGWEYLQDYVGYSYFRKAAAEAVGADEIFCDDDSKLEMLKRVFRRRVILLLMIFLFLLLPGFIRTLYCREYFDAVLMGIVMIMYLVLFTSFSCKYRKVKGKH